MTDQPDNHDDPADAWRCTPQWFTMRIRRSNPKPWYRSAMFKAIVISTLIAAPIWGIATAICNIFAPESIIVAALYLIFCGLMGWAVAMRVCKRMGV